ncbi:MAG: amino acid ABC transporter substrate-binding protein [Candidatus Bathyarchaeia archaeon]|jgi:branched-chain amino acid transport system substrate-binding protein
MKILDSKAITKMQAIIIVVVLIVVAVAASAYYITLPPAKNTILFGCSLSLTGTNAQEGALVLEGYQLWMNYTNTHGGLIGEKVNLIYYDDQSNPTLAETLYEKLITVDHVNFLLGPYFSSVGETAAVVAEKYNMVLIHALNNALALYNQPTYNNEFLAHSEGLSTNAQNILFQMLLSLPSSEMPKTIAMISLNSAFPSSEASGVQGLVKQYSSDGFSIAFQATVPSGVTDVTTQIEQAKASNAQILFCIGDATSEDLMVTTAAEFNYHPEVIMTATAAGVSTFRTQLGNDAYGCLYISGYNPTANNTLTQQYAQEFTAKYGTAPSSYDALGYRACQILGAAISATGSLNQNTVRNWLTTNTVQTNCGPWTVDQSLVAQGIKYVPVESAVITQQQPQGNVVVWPPADATAQFQLNGTVA